MQNHYPIQKKGGVPIAIYHMSMKIISRGKGQSATASAAYRAGEKIANEKKGVVHDYTHKRGVAKSIILLPENAPEQETPPTATPKPSPRTLKEVDLELGIIEGKLSRLEHASKVIMSYDHKIQDIERNLSSAGFFERRKMNKEIAEQEKRRSEYQKDTTKKYGTTWQLESEKSKLLTEKNADRKCHRRYRRS